MRFSTHDLESPASSAKPLIEWEEADCPLCGSRRWKVLMQAPDCISGGSGLWFAVVRCQECGLCFTNPRPTLATMASFYPSGYHPHRVSHERSIGKSWLGRNRNWAARERYVLSWHGQGRLLDFGCGGSSYLDRMHRQGWQVTGIDSSATAISELQAELGHRVLVGSLPHPDVEPASFDVITMWQSLEHVHDPREVLRAAHRALAPGGKLVVAVPNIESLAFRWFGPWWFGLDLPRHLTHFSPKTLSWMLELTGFRITSLRMVRHRKWLRSSARMACQQRRCPAWKRWLTHNTAARLATWFAFLTRQSDCVLAVGIK